MRFVDFRHPTHCLMPALSLALALGLSGCDTLQPRSSAGTGGPAATPSTGPASPEAATPSPASGGGRTSPSPPRAASAGKPFSMGRAVALPPPATSRNWADVRQQAARRLVAANPDITYMGKPQDVLLAIPVMTIELNADGSIRRLDVMRYPGQARDTVDIAIQALRRAAPFGDVSRLPKPWKFNETFLFSDQRKFKPMTLDR